MIRALVIVAALAATAACERGGTSGAYVGGGAGVSRVSR